MCLLYRTLYTCDHTRDIEFFPCLLITSDSPPTSRSYAAHQQKTDVQIAPFKCRPCRGKGIQDWRETPNPRNFIAPPGRIDYDGMQERKNKVTRAKWEEGCRKLEMRAKYMIWGDNESRLEAERKWNAKAKAVHGNEYLGGQKGETGFKIPALKSRKEGLGGNKETMTMPIRAPVPNFSVENRWKDSAIKRRRDRGAPLSFAVEDRWKESAIKRRREGKVNTEIETNWKVDMHAFDLRDELSAEGDIGLVRQNDRDSGEELGYASDSSVDTVIQGDIMVGFGGSSGRKHRRLRAKHVPQDVKNKLKGLSTNEENDKEIETSPNIQKFKIPSLQRLKISSLKKDGEGNKENNSLGLGLDFFGTGNFD